jgi:hypothetical protein
MLSSNHQDNSALNIYKTKAYIDKSRWVSYFWQTKLITDLIDSGTILEVGIGNKVLSNYLRSVYDITTVDIDEGLNPDYVGSVTDLSFLPAEKFDVVLCAEVLEHLPYGDFTQALNSLRRVSREYIILSLPYWGYTFGLRLRLPLAGVITLKFKINGFRPHIFTGQHYWEIGKQGYPLLRVKRAIGECGLKIRRSFWDLDDPYHYYFILEKC